jgi:deoxyribose-phosphate aldolase
MIVKALQQAELFKEKVLEKPSEKQLRQIISLIDYTTLNDTDSVESVTKWVKESQLLIEKSGVNFGGWCTYAEFAPLVKSLRGFAPVSIAVVSGNFPSGKAVTEIKVSESVLAEEAGAEEIDVVINKGWAVNSEYDKIEKEIKKVKNALSKAHLKVIMETGLLSPVQIQKISEIAINAGADYIKTSTGKIPEGASLEAVSIMCYQIRDHYEKTGKKIGIKPSGGISTPEEALRYVLLIERILGSGWIDSKFCRIGASRLLKNSIDQLIRD